MLDLNYIAQQLEKLSLLGELYRKLDNMEFSGGFNTTKELHPDVVYPYKKASELTGYGVKTLQNMVSKGEVKKTGNGIAGIDIMVIRGDISRVQADDYKASQIRPILKRVA